MKNVHVQRYSDVNKQLWDDFVSQAEVHSILFYRDFMEYHSHRFTDYSLLVFQENKLIAIMPANIDADNILHSHQGLSYGGLVFKPFTYFATRVSAFYELLRYLNSQDVAHLYLKAIPSSYTCDSSDKIIFHWLRSKNPRADIYAYLPKGGYTKPNKDRNKYLKKAAKEKLEIRNFDDYASFWANLLEPNLGKRFDVFPVHTSEEIELLAKKFPKQIQLFGAFQNGLLRAGIVLFIHKHVVHAQYIAGDDNRNDGSLDYLIDNVIKEFIGSHNFSFGSSSEEQGVCVNNGLLYWKESFGACNDTQPYYAIETKNYTLLENRLK